MSEYKGLKYRTRGNVRPQGRPRVFFSCHPDDFERMFEPVTTEILDIQVNAAIWYYDPKEGIPEGEEFLADLSQMQLFVVPVTSSYVLKENSARTVEFAYAIEHHIPVLPLMQEEGLDSDFNRVCGNIQFLDKYASEKDQTVLPYEGKLKRFLEHALVSDERIGMIRMYFPAYIFLSYRKKDRKYAQEIMRKIHQNRICRKVAIWYDEFLTPGENFNEEIEAAMNKCSLFAMVVTPNLLEDPNYVMTVEYPAAKTTGKPILPIEGVPVDRNALSRIYDGMMDPVTEEELPEKLREMLADVPVLEEEDLPINDFFIGLAYLSGIDVEVDHEKALELITSAAESGIQMACEQLVFMYQNGIGVERNFEKALQWQKKYIDVLENMPGTKKRYSVSIIQETKNLGDFQRVNGQSGDARKTFQKMLEMAKKLDEQSDDRLTYTAIAFNRLAWICDDEGRYSDAKSWFEKELQLTKKLAKKTKSTKESEHLAYCYSNIAYISRRTGNLSKAMEMEESALKLRQKISTETKTTDARYNVMDSYGVLGEISSAKGNYDQAEEYFRKAYDIASKLVEETNATKYRRGLFLCLKCLCELEKPDGGPAESEEWAELALEYGEKLAEETNLPRDRLKLSEVYRSLGKKSESVRNYADAESWYRKSLAILQELTEEFRRMDYRTELAFVYYELGDALFHQGKDAEAESWLNRSIELSEELAAEKGISASNRKSLQCDLANSYGMIAAIRKTEGRLADSKAGYEKAIDIIEKQYADTKDTGIQHNLFANYQEMGEICREEGNTADAKEWYQKALVIIKKLVQENDRHAKSRELSKCYSRMGEIHTKEGNLNAAKNSYLKALEIDRKAMDESPDWAVYEELAEIYDALGSNDIIPAVERSDYLQESILIWSNLRKKAKEKKYSERLKQAKEMYMTVSASDGLSTWERIRKLKSFIRNHKS